MPVDPGQHHRVIRAHAIEVGRGWELPRDEESFIPPSTEDPSPDRRRGRDLRHESEDFSFIQAPQVQPLVQQRSEARGVNVCVDPTGDGHPRDRQAGHIATVPSERVVEISGEDDPAVANDDRLDLRQVLVERDEPSRIDDIGWWGLPFGRRAGGEEEPGQHRSRKPERTLFRPCERSMRVRHGVSGECVSKKPSSQSMAYP